MSLPQSPYIQLQRTRSLFFLDPLVLQCPVGGFRLYQAPLLRPRVLFPPRLLLPLREGRRRLMPTKNK